jgi:hypothetical protein
MSSGRAVLLVRIGEVPSAIEETWNRWYNGVHMPARLAMPGFLGARRFKAYEGECSYVTVYELENVDALRSAPYLQLRQQEAAFPADSFEAQTANFPLLERGVYGQVFPDTPYEIPDAEYLFLLAHDVPPNREEEFTAWYNTEHIPAMLRVPGFLNARRFKMADPLPAASGKQSSRPQFITLYDIADKKAMESEQLLKNRESPWCDWVRSWYTRRLRVKARRISP